MTPFGARGHFAVKVAAWVVALAVIALPVVAVVNGWIGAGQWPFRQLRVEADFRKVEIESVQAAIAPTLEPGFFAVDLAAAREAVERLPWVAGAEVRKLWPDTIEVRIREYEPLARWNADRLVDGDGRIFSVPAGAIPEGLPSLEGPDERAPEVIGLMRGFAPRLALAGLRLSAVRLSARGSVELFLDGGAAIRLGREAGSERLDRFLAALPDAQPPRPGMRWARADLRYANGFALAWQAERPPPAEPPMPAAAASPKEGLDKSIQDLPAHAESGACPDSASRNQSLARLFRGPAVHGRRNLRINQRFPSTPLKNAHPVRFSSRESGTCPDSLPPIQSPAVIDRRASHPLLTYQAVFQQPANGPDA
jgi:cell division protein FtsQ